MPEFHAPGPSTTGSRFSLEVVDIFRLHGEDYRNHHPLSPEQKKAFADITRCRTAGLGGHVDVCDQDCGFTRISYNSCRNRHCPKCRSMTREEWLDKRREELLPRGYFHLVFTVPHELPPYILANRRELLANLFTAVKQTLFSFEVSLRSLSAADPQWKLSGRPGILAILHTWSQTLIDHFHIHCLVPAGALSFDKRRWTKSNDKFLFRVESLAKEFKRQYLSLLESGIKQLIVPPNATKLLENARQKEWIVYAKKPFAGPEQVLAYLGRYTHRIAISNHRIKSIVNSRIIFTYRDRSDGNQVKTMPLDAMEFIRRFLLHVLPGRFMKIRYYGFLANACKKKAVLLIRRLIGKYMEVKRITGETVREKMLRLTGRDILLCPHCRQGRMVFVGLLPGPDSG